MTKILYLEYMYKDFQNLTVKEPNNPTGKWAKDMERNFTEEDIPTKRCSISLDMKGVQIKTRCDITTHILDS